MSSRERFQQQIEDLTRLKQAGIEAVTPMVEVLQENLESLASSSTEIADILMRHVHDAKNRIVKLVGQNIPKEIKDSEE